MLNEFIIPIATIAAVVFLLIAMIYGGWLGALMALTVISAVRFLYAFFVWHG